MADERRRTEQDAWAQVLSQERTPPLWRGLSDLLPCPADEATQELLGEGLASTAPSRREFLQLLGASAALAGLGGCMQPPSEKVIPYNQRPREGTPGVPRDYATSMVLDGFATGVLVRSTEGRPTKIDGNPEHPASLGACGVFEQASVLQLYDPQRLRGVLGQGRPRGWQAALTELAAAKAGDRLRIVLEPQSSPTVATWMERLRRTRPGVRFTFHSAISRAALYEGARLAFGRALEPQHDFSRARAVVALDADFLSQGPFSLRWARQVGDARRVSSPTSDMLRLYVAEAALTPTGMLADHRLRSRLSDLGQVAVALLQAVRAAHPAPPTPELGPGAGPPLDPAARAWVQAAARDLTRHAGASVVLAGVGQPAEVHALTHAINALLGNVGQTVSYTEPVLLESDTPSHSLETLSEELRAGAVETLVILEGNPAFTAPVELQLARRIRAVPRSIHLSLYANETSEVCGWVLPAAHYLESWGEARALDGTLSLQQPLIAPLYGGRTPAELLATIAVPQPPGALELLRGSLIERLGEGGGAAFEQHLQRGLVADSTAPTVSTTPRWSDIARAATRLAGQRPRQGLELHLPPSAQIYDGRFANNGWLMELPEPATKLSWDNAALLSPLTAVRLGLKTEEVIDLERGGRSLRVPVLVAPGQADETLSLHLGFGRRAQGEALAKGVGVDPYRLRPGAASFVVGGVRLKRTGLRQPLAVSQAQGRLEGRPIAFVASLAEYRGGADVVEGQKGPLPSLLPLYPQEGEQWAMSIDTGLCSGCSACMVACQAENNVPVVGKAGVLKHREMHWLRIDRYFTGGVADPEVVNQPMLCQHCEQAPCEYVCPVNATVHSPDGLNEMVYNRCIGTRTCSNNCPYKVRRFNWFDYVDRSTVKLQRNPQVTVRERGVMEKCTYCVQRIRGAEIRAQLERRAIAPGEVVTACQQACPTRAISFGSLRHRHSEMVRWRRQPRAYAALHDQGTVPRTLYLAKLVDRDPTLAALQPRGPTGERGPVEGR